MTQHTSYWIETTEPTSYEPLGGLHDADDGPLARKGEAAICLRCGSTSDTAPDDIVPGQPYPGGPPDPAALARPARARGSGGRSTGRGRSGGRGGGRGAGRSRRSAEPASES